MHLSELDDAHVGGVQLAHAVQQQLERRQLHRLARPTALALSPALRMSLKPLLLSMHSRVVWICSLPLVLIRPFQCTRTVSLYVRACSDACGVFWVRALP